MSVPANTETVREFRARVGAEDAKARHEAMLNTLRWGGIIAVLVIFQALLCIASVIIDRAVRDPVVVLEHKGVTCKPAPLADIIRDKLRRH